MAKKDSVIFYQEQIKICKKHLTAEQFGRLMMALFELDDGGDPVVDDDIALAFDFMSLQQKIDRDKYERICERNRSNGQKGGAPKGNQNAKNNPKQPKTTQNNPNENENENENENDKRMIREENDSGLSLFGSLSNVQLTPQEYQNITDKYEDPDGLIDRVSRWLPNAKHNVPDHYEAILNFATKSNWSKKRILKPPPPEREIDPKDMPTEEEQAEMVASIKKKIGFNVIG